MKKYIVSVICLGNMARSPIAAYCLNREIAKHKMNNNVIVLSRGITGLANTNPNKYTHPKYYVEVWKHLEPLLKRYKINLDGHHSRVVTETHLNKAVLVLPVHSNVLHRTPNGLKELFQHYTWKMRLLRELVGKYQDIEDIGKSTSKHEFRDCIEIIDETARLGVGYIFDWIDNIEKNKQIIINQRKGKQ